MVFGSPCEVCKDRAFGRRRTALCIPFCFDAHGLAHVPFKDRLIRRAVVDHLFRVSRACAPRVSRASIRALCNESEDAAARRDAFYCRLLNAHGGIEALLVVVSTTG